MAGGGEGSTTISVDEFWSTIDEARARAVSGDAGEIAERLREVLASRTPAEVYAYLDVQGALMARSYRWDLWGAAYVANGGCSDDGFDYFRGWLFAQGRAVFERALIEPDSIADVEFETDDAFCEDMIGAGTLAYKDLTGEYPAGPRHPYPELGPSWDFDDGDEMRRRYPRVTAKIGR